METKSTQNKNTTVWNKMVHAPFKRVVAFDLFCIGIGIAIGMGLGAYLVS